MARAYTLGDGVKKDLSMALSWWKKSAANKLAEAMYHLANAYEHGWGTKKDPAEAAKWRKEVAAEHALLATASRRTLNIERLAEYHAVAAATAEACWANRLKPRIGIIAKEYHDLGFVIVATDGTRKAIKEAGVPCDIVHKIAEGRRPNILDMMKNGEIAMIINTPNEKETRKDEVLIRSTSVSTRTPIQTTLRGARAAAHAIGCLQKNKLEVHPLQEYHP